MRRFPSHNYAPACRRSADNFAYKRTHRSLVRARATRICRCAS